MVMSIVKELLKDIGLSIVEESMNLYYDNKTALNLAKNLVLHDTKHVEIVITSSKRKLSPKELFLLYVKSEIKLLIYL